MTKPHLFQDWQEVRRKVDGGHGTAYDLQREKDLRQLLFGVHIYRAERAVEQARQVARQLQAQRQRPVPRVQSPFENLVTRPRNRR